MRRFLLTALLLAPLAELHAALGLAASEELLLHWLRNGFQFIACTGSNVVYAGGGNA